MSNMKKNNKQMSFRKTNNSRNSNVLLQKNKRNRRRRNNRNVNGDYNIGMVKNAPIQTRCIRYTTTAIQDDVFSSQDLLNWVGFATTTTAGYSLCESFRIKRLKFTLLPSDTQAPASVSFKWVGTNTPHDEIVITAIPAVPAVINLYPPPDSNAAWWQSDFSVAIPMFSFDDTSFGGAQLDIEFEWVMLADATSNALTTLSGATANTIVYPRQPETGSKIWTPFGLPSG